MSEYKVAGFAVEEYETYEEVEEMIQEDADRHLGIIVENRNGHPAIVMEADADTRYLTQSPTEGEQERIDEALAAE